METGKKLGFKKGDFVFTGAFPGIIISDVHTFAPCCEVWGFYHEMGSAYAEDLTLLSWPEFKTLAERYGFDGTGNAEVSKDAIKRAMEEQTAAVPATA